MDTVRLFFIHPIAFLKKIEESISGPVVQTSRKGEHLLARHFSRKGEAVQQLVAEDLLN